MVYAINKFRHYITIHHVYIHIDHSTIKYLRNKSYVNARIIRWIFLPQELDITILDKHGSYNVVTYLLSRLTHDAEKYLVDDSFPDGHLFSI
jgi:ribosomal protein S6